MQVTVLVDGQRFFVSDGKVSFGGLLGAEIAEINALVGDQADELDIVGFQHGVNDTAHLNVNGPILQLNHGQVLFHRTIAGAGLERLHGFAAANKGDPLINDLGHHVAAVRAAVENDGFKCMCHGRTSFYETADEVWARPLGFVSMTSFYTGLV